MAEELRSALALSRAREQINKSHLKEVQSENKKLKELLREEKMSNQQILRKLSNLQQQKQKKSNNINNTNRRASTGNALYGTDTLFKSIGTQTLRTSKQTTTTTTAKPTNTQQRPFHYNNKKYTNKQQYIQSLEKQLEQQHHIHMHLKKQLKETSGNLIILMNALGIFEKAVIGPVNKDGSISPHPPTVKEITRDAKRERIEFNHQQEKKMKNITMHNNTTNNNNNKKLTSKTNDNYSNSNNILPNSADVENMILSLSDLANETIRLRSMMDDDNTIVNGDTNNNNYKETNGNNNNNNNSDNTPSRNEVLASKLRIFQQISKQKEMNYMEEAQRMEEEILRLNTELKDLKQINQTIEEQQEDTINTLGMIDMFDPNSMEKNTLNMIDEIANLRIFCEKQIKMKINQNDNEKKKLTNLLENFNNNNNNNNARDGNNVDGMVVTTPNGNSNNNKKNKNADEEKIGKFI